MNLLPQDVGPVVSALAMVQLRTDAVAQLNDLEAKRRALFLVSTAAIKAIAVLEAAESAARSEALRKLETV